MADDCENTQTQTQNSQFEWSQQNTPSIPTIWGRLYATKAFTAGKFNLNPKNPEYYDLIQHEFSFGRALNCSVVAKTGVFKDTTIVKNVSKQQFIIRKDLSEPQSPAIITDLSYNGTYINGEKIGKGNCRVLDDNDKISVTHQLFHIITFKDLLKTEPDKVHKEISKKYYISKTLGQGACGVVKLVYDKKRCTKHAMKIIKKSRMTNGLINNLNDPQKIMNEINIMKSLRHPCIISIEQVYDSPEAVYMVLELMQGGELFDRITKPGYLTEQLTRFLFRQIVLAVKYLHTEGITHRDLKPENVLLESKDDNTLVKITDFGLSKFVGEDSFMKTMCGTPLYLAPEVLKSNGRKCYGPEVDVWSLGVIFFMCLVGYQPFSSDYKTLSLKDQILRGRFRFSHAHWKHVSIEAKALMKRMLTVEVDRRITLDQILNHSWMQDRDVIIRVEKLLSHKVLTREMSHLTVSSESTTDENDNPQTVSTVITFVATKRGLNDSYSSCEPIPKKQCIDSNKQDDTTSTTNSYCSEE